MARTITGVVSSDKANKTIVITVQTRKTHPLYKKQYTVTSKFMAHDENNEAKLGDKVVIVETRPLSARKHFNLQTIIEKARVLHVEDEGSITGRKATVKKKLDSDDKELNVTASKESK